MKHPAGKNEQPNNAVSQSFSQLVNQNGINKKKN